MLPQLLPLLDPDRKLYCEPFAGGLALLLAKPRSTTEVVNDINGDLVALYRCAQFHLEPLLTEFEFILGSRENMADMLAQPGLTDLQRAARFLARNRFSFGANGDCFAVSRQGPGIASRANVLPALRALNARLDRVSVEHLDWQRCIALYDCPEAQFFLDPPYLHAQTRIYRGWAEADMRGLSDVLDSLKGTWILTVDDSTYNRRLFARHEITPVKTANGLAKNEGEGKTFGELIIRPRPAAAAGRKKAA